MINNTALYNLANYETLHAEWDKDVRACRDLCFKCCDLLHEAITACYDSGMRKGIIPDYTIADNMGDKFDLLHKDNWVTPVIKMNNEMFAKSLNPNVNHLVEAGMDGLRAYLTIPPENDQDRYEILEYIERMQPIMANYKQVMTDLFNEEKGIIKTI